MGDKHALSAFSFWRNLSNNDLNGKPFLRGTTQEINY